MIYYSIVPLEIVLQGRDYNNIDYSTKIVQYCGCQVEVSTSNGVSQIQRVFSTSLKDYLNPKLQPGMNIDSY